MRVNMNFGANPYQVLDSIYLTDKAFMDLAVVQGTLMTIVYKRVGDPGEFQAVIEAEGDFRGEVLAEKAKRMK